jgi:hypothetical protein
MGRFFLGVTVVCVLLLLSVTSLKLSSYVVITRPTATDSLRTGSLNTVHLLADSKLMADTRPKLQALLDLSAVQLPAGSKLPAYIKPELQALLDRATAVGNTYGGKAAFRGMGHVGEVPEEVNALIRFSAHALRDKPEGRMCEVGFNAGHSAITLLHSNPRASYVAFDIGELRWSKAAVELLGSLFPGRFFYRKGKAGGGSALLEYAEEIKAGTAQPCDFFSVDGDHSYAGSKADFANGANITNVGGYVFADDYTANFPGVKKAWMESKSNNLIDGVVCEEVTDRKFNGYSKAWCLGRYKPSE